MEDEVPTFLKQHRVRNIRKFVTTSVEQVQELTKLENLPLHSMDLDQISIFRDWYADLLRRKKRISNDTILEEFSEEVWEKHHNEFLLNKMDLEAAQAMQSPPGTSLAITLPSGSPALAPA